MKIIISGVTGFIGSNLLPLIIRDKNIKKILLISRDTKKIDRKILSNPKVKLLKVDLVKKSLPHIPRHDLLIHLADIIPSNKGDVQNFSENIIIIENIINNIILKNTVKKVIYTSTLDVYGKPFTLPIYEDHPTNPLTFYGISKLSSELFIKRASAKANIKYIILRLSQVYGRGEPLVKVIPLFIKKIVSDEKITLENNGNIIRDWVYIKDAISAIKAAIYTDINDTFNIATGRGYSLKELVTLLGEIIGTKPRLNFSKSCSDLRPKIVLSIEKAKKYLAYTPLYDLNKGMRDYLN